MNCKYMKSKEPRRVQSPNSFIQLRINYISWMQMCVCVLGWTCVGHLSLFENVSSAAILL